MTALLFVLAASLAVSPNAFAHDLLLSTVELRGNTVVVITPLSHLVRAESGPGASLSAIQIDQALRQRLQLRWNGSPVLIGPSNLEIDPSTDMVRWQTSVPGPPGQLTLAGKLFPEEAASSVRFRSVNSAGNAAELWLGPHPQTAGAGEATASVEFWQFVVMGASHIFEGPDHIALIVGLILLGGTLRSLLVTVTSFTVAHSITLGLAATGLLVPPSHWVEPLIALSIVAIAVENLVRRGSLSRRPYYAFGFGLIHGFGIAGPMHSLGIATSVKGLVFALAPFNVGVELAQASIVVAFWPLLHWLGRERPVVRLRLATAGSVVIGILGCLWFVQRSDLPGLSQSVLAAPAATSPDGIAAKISETFKPFAPAVVTRHDDSRFYVESNGMPDHRMMVGITAWQQQVPIPQSYRGSNAWQFPLYPTPAAVPLSAREHFFRGAIAIAANGVPIFNPIKNDGVTDTFLAGELDEFGGHGGRADDYHYHTAPLHLQKVLGNALPVAYALDGYPIYGLTEPDGSSPGKLDSFNGHAGKDGGYHYHATKAYPYLNGGFHGEVVEREGQVDPQPSAQPIRPAERPLRGAKITGFEKLAGDSYTLIYTVYGETHEVHYTVEPGGHSTFDFIDGQGAVRTEHYRQRDPSRPPRRGPDQGGPPR